MHASEAEWEEGRECVVLFFILSPFKRGEGRSEGGGGGERGGTKGAAGTFSIMPANYPQLSKPLNSQCALSRLFQWQRPRTFFSGKAGHLI